MTKVDVSTPLACVYHNQQQCSHIACLQASMQSRRIWSVAETRYLGVLAAQALTWGSSGEILPKRKEALRQVVTQKDKTPTTPT